MATKKLTCSADVSISEQYSSKAYNASDRLAFGRGAASGDRYWVLLKFSSLGLDAAKYKITKAVLTVKKISGALGFNSDMNARALRVTSSWNESTTWETKPSATTTGQSAVKAMGEGHSGSVSFDVTDIVLAWQSGSSQYGVCLQQSDSTASRIKTIADRTSSGAAYITVTYAEIEPSPTKPSLGGFGGSITTDSQTFRWQASTDNVYASSKLSYQLQVSLDGGSSWSSNYTTSAGVTSCTVNIRTLAGLKSGQYYYNTKLKFRVRAVTPAFNGTVYYSDWSTSINEVVDYRIKPDKPSSLNLSASQVYEGQSLTVTLGKPASFNSYDSNGNAMKLTYIVKFADGATLGSVTVDGTSATATVTATVPNKTSGLNDLSTTVTAVVKDAEGQTGTKTSATNLTVKRYRNPSVTIAVSGRTETTATIRVTVTDTGYGGSQVNSNLDKVQYKLASGSWTAATASWSGLVSNITISGLTAAARYAFQVRVYNKAPNGLSAKYGTSAAITILEHTPAAMVFKDSANNKTGIATKSLMVGADWSEQVTDGQVKVAGSLSVGPKTSSNDGKNGVSMGNSGYIMIQRATSGKPYISFYMPDATTASGLIQTSASAMEFRNAAKYDFSAPIVVNGANVLTDADPIGLSNILQTLFLGNIASAPNDLAEKTNLDNLTPGSYRSVNASRSATLVNPPTTSAGFRLYVSNLTSSTTYIQCAVGYSSEVNIWFRVKTSAWGVWKKLTLS